MTVLVAVTGTEGAPALIAGNEEAERPGREPRDPTVAVLDLIRGSSVGRRERRRPAPRVGSGQCSSTSSNPCTAYER